MSAYVGSSKNLKDLKDFLYGSCKGPKGRVVGICWAKFKPKGFEGHPYKSIHFSSHQDFTDTVYLNDLESYPLPWTTQLALQGFSTRIWLSFRYIIRMNPLLPLRLAYRRVVGLHA